MSYAKFAMLAVVGIVIGLVLARMLTPDRYGAWRGEDNGAIAFTLASKGMASGACKKYVYRENLSRKGEYHVKCSADGDIWRHYLVFPGLAAIEGPLKKWQLPAD